MTDLVAVTALGGSAPATARFGALGLAETPDLALASLALREGAAPPVLPDLVLPGPGGWAAGGDLAAFWTGPGQWMIEGPGRAEADFAGEIATLAPGAAVTEQTDAWVAFDIASTAGAGPILRLMEKLVNIDVAGFGSGRATRTGLEHMSVFLVRRAEDRLGVLGMRSAAGSLWHALTTAAARQGGG